MVIAFSPFNFEKLCLKGDLEANLFAFHFTTDNFQEKNRGREKIIFPFYITNGHFFGLCPKKFEVREARTVLSLQKVLSLFNGQNESECHDFVSQTFLSHFTTDIFLKKTWHPISKNFSCLWSSLYLAKWIRDRFCPRFLEKVSETAKQSLCIASNCPFYFPTDKMMRRVTVLS